MTPIFQKLNVRWPILAGPMRKHDFTQVNKTKMGQPFGFVSGAGSEIRSPAGISLKPVIC